MAKHKKAQRAAQLPARQPSGIALAASWPVVETLISRDWQNYQSLATILIARQSPKTGRVAAGSFLVDLACLGVKQAQVSLYKDIAEYRGGMRAHLMGHRPMVPGEFNLAAKIVLTGLEYAEQLGFKPDAVYAQAQYVLAGADPQADPTPVPTGGPNGKPLFVSGPYDDVPQIMAQLTRTVGDGNFDFVIQGDQDW
jgi:hypothetical protein